MAHHFTRNTLEASRWCNRCKKFTSHKVDHGRIAHCLPCAEKSEAERLARAAHPPEPASMQEELFA